MLGKESGGVSEVSSLRTIIIFFVYALCLK